MDFSVTLLGIAVNRGQQNVVKWLLENFQGKIDLNGTMPVWLFWNINFTIFPFFQRLHDEHWVPLFPIGETVKKYLIFFFEKRRFRFIFFYFFLKKNDIIC